MTPEEKTAAEESIKSNLFGNRRRYREGFMRGFDAFLCGFREMENPQKKQSTAYAGWNDGWWFGKERKQNETRPV